MTAHRDRYLKRGLRRIHGWLSPYSAQFIRSVTDIQAQAGETGAVAEIGVHHGKLFILLALSARAGETVLAIDVFDDQHLNVDQSGRGDRAVFQRNVQAWAPDADVKIVQKSSLDVAAADILAMCGPVRLASIDGGHTEECVQNDLRLFEATLAPRGVVILDDYFNQSWPGVSSGTAQYLLDPTSRLRPFAISPNKLYLAFDDALAFYRAALRNKDAYYYERSARFMGCDVDVYGTHDHTFAFKRRLIDTVKRTPLGPHLRAIYASMRRQNAR
ncbi:class I SAM-dependent methyltransferase [Reyranella sp. CPCC 100927]|uniref:class I SAM-dependent methyltransferase n=1 Tax=Reyranella sp. CPCC 100927 TaxID=2599616 RepID=UPI0011B4FD94|nr:class I SAM-dependent methyltransferase [Reyranella sp. CPCC 100927]TWS98334.1 class I SAM-dependent methyltransferase [Reyranella sp. CPCC 100927]